MQEKRKCTKCKQEKSLHEDFHKAVSRPKGRSYTCKECAAKNQMNPDKREARLLVKNRYAKKKRDKDKELRLERAALLRKSCSRCGGEFKPTTASEKYCSSACRQASWKESQERYRRTEQGKQKIRIRSLGRVDRIRAQRMRVAFDEPVYLRAIADRDGWMCHICGEEVSKQYSWPHPLSPSRDHVIPLAKGGRHREDNVKLAHLVCNQRKHGK